MYVINDHSTKSTNPNNQSWTTIVFFNWSNHMNQNCQSKICKMNAKESQYQSHNEIPGRNRCRCSSISIGKVRNNRHAAIKFQKSMLTAFFDCSADRTKCKIFFCGNMTVDLPLSKHIFWFCFQCNINFNGNVSKHWNFGILGGCHQSANVVACGFCGPLWLKQNKLGIDAFTNYEINLCVVYMLMLIYDYLIQDKQPTFRNYRNSKRWPNRLNQTKTNTKNVFKGCKTKSTMILHMFFKTDLQRFMVQLVWYAKVRIFLERKAHLNSSWCALLDLCCDTCTTTWLTCNVHNCTCGNVFHPALCWLFAKDYYCTGSACCMFSDLVFHFKVKIPLVKTWHWSLC